MKIKLNPNTISSPVIYSILPSSHPNLLIPWISSGSSDGIMMLYYGYGSILNNPISVVFEKFKMCHRFLQQDSRLYGCIKEWSCFHQTESHEIGMAFNRMLVSQDTVLHLYNQIRGEEGFSFKSSARSWSIREHESFSVFSSCLIIDCFTIIWFPFIMSVFFSISSLLSFPFSIQDLLSCVPLWFSPYIISLGLLITFLLIEGMKSEPWKYSLLWFDSRILSFSYHHVE